MANRYSDIVDLRSGRSTYYIEDEKDGEWSVFIINEQFNDILRNVVRSTQNNDYDAHKSFWIEGTYGSGKSHAGAVIKHLLCDTVEDIEEWVNGEYKLPQFDTLRSSIFALRKKKRLLPVTMYGNTNISHPDDLSLQLQRKIQSALIKAGLTDLNVKTDFDSYVEHIDENPKFWELIIEQSPKLAAWCPTVDKLRTELQEMNSKTLREAQDAVRESGLHVRMKSANLINWFFEVQDKLKEETEYEGLFILWDEFTNLLQMDIGPTILVTLQEISERAMAQENDSYFLFITHPSALNSLKAEERTKTKGRYHFMKYNMEPVSAYKIMSRKFRQVASEEEYIDVFSPILSKFDGLLAHYTQNSPNAVETSRDIRNLMPLHPATALLATFYAREAGSASRSVFEFLGDNKTIREFLDSENIFLNRHTITADYLWDYVVDEFNENVAKFGAVTERFNTYRAQIEDAGDVEYRVFKGILLLNALNNIANHDDVTPSEENVLRLFEGTPFSHLVPAVLNLFDTRGYIQRAPGNIFSIQFTALPTKEIEDAKEQLRTRDFKYISQILNFNNAAAKEVDKLLINLCRPYSFRFYSLDVNEYTLLNKIENGSKEAKGYEIFLALLFGKTPAEISQLRDIAEKASADQRFKNTVFIVFDAPLTEKSYERFIEYQANAKIAQKFNFTDQYNAHIKNARKMVEDWISKEVRQVNFYLYLRGVPNTYSASKLTSTLDRIIAPQLFPFGPEGLDKCVGKSKTFWKKESTKKIVQLILNFNSKQDILAELNNQQSLVKILFEESLDDNLEFKADIDTEHNPLYLVCRFVDNKIKHADKQSLFNLAEKFEDLSRPPYGLFETCSCMAMLAFAMRKHIGKMFDTGGKPREAQHLVEDVVDIFKCWEKGTPNTKLSYKFETKEEGMICKGLIKVFGLTAQNGYPDVSSLTDTRWTILHKYSASMGYPLWALKYAVPSSLLGSDNGERAKQIIDDILTICFETAHRNPQMMSALAESLKTLDFELRSWVHDTNAFRQGFEIFLMSNTHVSLKQEDIQEAFEYIKQNMPGEVGEWRKEDVDVKLLHWGLSKKQTPTPPTPPDPGPTPTPQPTPTPPSPDKVEEAKDKIHSITSINEAQEILLRLIDLGYDDIVDAILN